MGKGIALEFKQRYLDNFLAYEYFCKMKYLNPGEVFQHQVSDLDTPSGCPLIIWNMATKNHWRDPSQYHWVQSGLSYIRHWGDWFCTSWNRQMVIAMPMPGCGNGGLCPSAVGKMIIDTLKGTKSMVLVFPGPNNPAFDMEIP